MASTHAKLISGTQISDLIKQELKAKIQTLISTGTSRSPCLAPVSIVIEFSCRHY